jgi:DNA polymerase
MRAARRRDESIDDPAAWTAAALRDGISLHALRVAAAHCHGCPLWLRATQTVFGRGPARPGLMLVGEQPGDVEDRQGEPFVGPAGRLLERALAAAGTSREQVYLTNAVKHFSWEERGKARIHKKPRPAESRACRPWLIGEIALLAPRVLVALGATAAQSLLGSTVRVLRDRGKPIASQLAPTVYVTVHPSALLREPDEAARHAAFDALVADLRLAVDAL